VRPQADRDIKGGEEGRKASQPSGGNRSDIVEKMFYDKVVILREEALSRLGNAHISVAPGRVKKSLTERDQKECAPLMQNCRDATARNSGLEVVI